MKYLKDYPWLYYMLSSYESGYTEDPVGPFDVDKVKFRAPVLEQEAKPRTLILNDPTELGWSMQEQKALELKLKELMRTEGFTLYVRSSDGQSLRKIEPYEHDFLLDRKTAIFTPIAQVIKSEPNLQNKAMDEIRELTPLRVRQLIYGPDIHELELDVSVARGLNIFKMDLDVFEQNINAMHRVPLRWVLSRGAVSNISTLNWLQAQGRTVKIAIRDMGYINEAIDKKIPAFEQTVAQAPDAHYQFDVCNVSDYGKENAQLVLTRFDVAQIDFWENRIPPEGQKKYQLSDLKIKEGTAIGYTGSDLDEILRLNDNHKAHVKQMFLTLPATGEQSGKLAAVLAKTTGIEELNLTLQMLVQESDRSEEGAGEDPENFLKTAGYSHLQKITLKDMGFSTEFYETLYERGHELRELHLINIAELKADHDFHLSKNPEKLEYLEISQASLLSRTLKGMIQSCRNLHTLILDKIKTNELLSLENYHSTVKNLILRDENDFGDDFLRSLLQGMQGSLEILSFEKNCNNFLDVRDILNRTQLEFPQLKKLKLGFALINQVKMILEICPNIESLEIEKLSGGVFDSLGTCFKPSLKTLKIGTVADSSTVSWLKQQAPNLMHVEVKGKPENFKQSEPMPIPAKTEHSNTIKLSAQRLPQTYHIPKLFEEIGKKEGESDPAPSDYREYVYDQLLIHAQGDRPFELVNELPAGVELYAANDLFSNAQHEMERFKRNVKNKSHRLVHAKHEMMLTETWQPLPGLSPYDKLSHFSFAEIDQENIEFGYHKKYRQFCLRLKKGVPSQNVEMKYLIKLPLREKVPQLSPHHPIRSLVKQYEKNVDSDVDLSGKTISTGGQLMDELIKQKKGSCEHKSIAFFEEMRRKNDRAIQTFVVKNRCHAFVEVEDNKEGTVQFQLGGHGGNTYIPDQGLFERRGLINPAFVIHEKEKTSEHPKIFAQKLLSETLDKGKTILVDLSSDDAVEAFQKMLRQLAKDTHRPIYYIDSPDDIRCQAKRLIRDENNAGHFIDGPCGPLNDFLEKEWERPPILLVNWNNFTPKDIVGFNALLDKVRIADGVVLKDNYSLIGLYHSHKPDAYTGADFEQRFEESKKPTYTSKDIPELPTNAYQSKVAEHIYLHESDDWKNILLGTWNIQGKNMQFDTGPFISALRKGGVVIHDPPLHDREYQNFINQVNIEKKVEISGVTHYIPKLFSVTQGPPYPYVETAQTCIAISELEGDSFIPPGILVLNPCTFSKFFRQEEMTSEGMIFKAGLLKSRENPLTLYMSHPLSPSYWSRLIHAAHTASIQLNIIVRPGMTLPAGLEPNSIVSLRSQQPDYPLDVYETNNPQAMINMLNVHSKALVIDCTGMGISELFEKTDAKMGENEFEFNVQEGAVIQALKAGRNVILRGTLSLILRQYLSAWALKHNTFKGDLTVVSEQALPEFIPISHYEKFNDKAALPLLNPVFKETASNDFIGTRNALLNEALKAQPIVLITGSTGVGKSTFIKKYFSQHVTTDIKHWLESAGGILFVDEFNITDEQKHQWTEFAGLLNRESPEIVFEGKSYPLSANHKVIFAGNPHSYGGERHQPALFEHYQHAVVTFEPLPDQYLKDYVLMPLLNHIPDKNRVCDIFIEMYQTIIKHSGHDILITPRELEHMALMFLIHYQTSPQSTDVLAKSCAGTLARILLPPVQHSLLPPNDTPLIYPLDKKNYPKDYVMTDSRIPIESRLNEMLQIRHYKNTFKVKGGLGGIVLEGDPGTGKSEHVVAQLVAAGLTKGDMSKPCGPDVFYRILVTMSYTEKEAIIKKATRENAVVLIDEINNQPMMERLLNDVLSGHDNNVLLIGTQNSAFKQEGRLVMSKALQRRTLTCHVPCFRHDEMIEILHKGHHVPVTLAKEIVLDFERTNKSSKKPLSFRHFIKNHEKAIEYVKETYAQRDYPTELLQSFREYHPPIQKQPIATTHAMHGTYDAANQVTKTSTIRPVLTQRPSKL